MSGPVPSPSMKQTIGSSGTSSSPPSRTRICDPAVGSENAAVMITLALRLGQPSFRLIFRQVLGSVDGDALAAAHPEALFHDLRGDARDAREPEQHRVVVAVREP